MSNLPFLKRLRSQNIKYGLLSPIQDEKCQPDQETLLSVSTLNEHRDSYHPAARKYRLLGVLALILAVLSTAATTSLIIRSRRMMLKNHRAAWSECGSTVEEARKRGCHFEPMLTSWVPHACYIGELWDEYDPLGDRKWYLDEDLTRELEGKELEDAKSGVYTTLYTNGSFHDEHCLYAWRKLATVVDRRLPLIDEKSAQAHHSIHCAQSIAEFMRNSSSSTAEPRGLNSINAGSLRCVEMFVDV